MGHGRPLEPPDNNSTRNPQFATRSMGVAEPSPSVPRKDGEGTYKLVGELAPITSNGPRLEGSTHDFTSWGAPNADDARYVCVALPSEGPKRRPERGGSEWEPIKILLEGD
jgi:hypothetical protein